ncbi:MAG: hypothetical protein K2N84_02985 [Clostridia bacterium]|nr:hypothetical protein [Clostridia bacterium]MDE7296209.1 hypothetical protein [Clostridia bacterium]
MEKVFCLGLMLGAVGGALLVANSYKARSLVKKSQSEVMQKVNDMMDEKLQACSENGSEKKSKKA